MYDGMCSLMLVPYRYPKKLEAMGIKCKMFSPIKPVLSTVQNNRDHRKILVVDGRTAIIADKAFGMNEPRRVLVDFYSGTYKLEDCKRFNIFKKTAGHILRLFAPLM